MTGLAGTEIRKGIKKKQKSPSPHPQPEREHPAREVSPKSPCGTIPLEIPPSSRTGRIDQKMKKVRRWHSLHVPPCKFKTR